MWTWTHLIPDSLLTLGTKPWGTVDADSKETVKTSPSLAQELPVNRPKDTELVVDPHVAQWVVRTMTRAVATYAVIVGVTILLGGPSRFAGLSYEVARDTPGAPESWGLSIIAAGVLMLVGSIWAKPRLIGLGAVIGAIWALLFASAFGVAAWWYDEANTTAPWAYLLIFVFCGLVAGAHFAMHPVEVPWRRKRKG